MGSSSLWPVEPHQTKKVLSLMTMMFLFCFTFTLLSDLKDILVLDSSDGAEPILYLKLIFVLPFSFLMMILYTKLLSYYSKAQLFNMFMWGFVATFSLLLVLYALQSKIEPDYRIVNGVPMKWSDYMASTGQISPRLEPLFKLFDFWINSLLYVVSEMWGSVGLQLLFWGYVNDICSLAEAKKFYPVIYVGGTLSVMIGGFFLFGYSYSMTDEPKTLRYSKSEINNNFLYILLSVAILNSLLIIFFYKWMRNNITTVESTANKSKNPLKKKMTFSQSLKFVFSSRYVLKIAVMVLFYGLLTNFTDTYHKNVLSLQYLHKDEKLRIRGIESILSGLMVMILCIFVAGKASRRIGWTWSALICPICITVFGIIFLSFQVFYKNDFAQMFDRKNMSDFRHLGYIPDRFNGGLVFPVYILGVITLIASKALNYSFFDPAKEMAYIPLDKEVRVKAKAAVDVVGSRFGKSGSAFIQVIYMLAFDRKIASDYIELIFGLFIFGSIVWIYSIVSLGKSFHEYTREVEENEMATCTDVEKSDFENIEIEKTVKTTQ